VPALLSPHWIRQNTNTAMDLDALRTTFLALEIFSKICWLIIAAIENPLAGGIGVCCHDPGNSD
jgi:hypothetical protein